MNSQVIISVFFFAMGVLCYLSDWVIGIIICELLLSVNIVFKDFSRGIRNANFLSYYSLFSILYIVGNFMVVYSMDTTFAEEYDFYLSKDHILDAAMVALVGHIGFIIGYLAFTKNISNFTFSGIIADTALKPTIIIIILYNIQFFFTGIDIQILNFFSYPFLFLFIKSAARKNKPDWINISILLVCLMSIKGALFAYRRQSALEPFFIFFIAVAIAYGNNWKKIISIKYILMLLCFIFLVLQFNNMGDVRKFTGEERLNKWTEIADSNVEQDPIEEDEHHSPLARASTINQLSQVVRLQNKNDYYNGSTIAYISFAFIPRFLWPEKPLIMQGRWFALEAGLAYNHGDQRNLMEVNNSINMTVAGELFLNFGYLGVLLGMILIGYLLKQCWAMSNLYDTRNNLTGTIFGVFLIIVAYFYLQVDMQFIVTLTQVFLTVLAINYFMKTFLRMDSANLVARN